MTSPIGIVDRISKNPLVRRMAVWMDAMAHPSLAIEISFDRLAGVRFGRSGSIEDFVVESLPAGAILPSASEPNLVDVAKVKTALESVSKRLHGEDQDVTLLLPDPVIRVFVQHFDDFPRSPEEAIPMLRWKLKKSVPFAIDETIISYMRQSPRENGVNVVTALARQTTVREYDAVAESVGLHAGVILNSSLAAIALLEGEAPALMARVSGAFLTTAIVQGGVLCAYRCVELSAQGKDLTPKMLLDEIFPVAAYYQDHWHAGVQSVHLAGLRERFPEFAGLLEQEFHCPVQSLLLSARSSGLLPEFASALVASELDGLAGWMLHRA